MQQANKKFDLPPGQAQAIRERYYPIGGNWIMASWLGVYVQLRLDQLQETFSLSESTARFLDHASVIFLILTLLVGIAILQYARFKLYGWDFITAFRGEDAGFRLPTAGWFVLVLILVVESLMLAIARP